MAVPRSTYVRRVQSRLFGHTIVVFGLLPGCTATEPAGAIKQGVNSIVKQDRPSTRAGLELPSGLGGETKLDAPCIVLSLDRESLYVAYYSHDEVRAADVVPLLKPGAPIAQDALLKLLKKHGDAIERDHGYQISTGNELALAIDHRLPATRYGELVELAQLAGYKSALLLVTGAQRGHRLRFPPVSPDPNQPPFEFALSSSGLTLANAQQQTHAQLLAVLEKVVETHEQAIVHIKPEPGVTFGQLFDLVTATPELRRASYVVTTSLPSEVQPPAPEAAPGSRVDSSSRPSSAQDK